MASLVGIERAHGVPALVLPQALLGFGASCRVGGAGLGRLGRPIEDRLQHAHRAAPELLDHVGFHEGLEEARQLHQVAVGVEDGAAIGVGHRCSLSSQVAGCTVQPVDPPTQLRLVTKCNRTRHTRGMPVTLTSDERRELLLDVTRDLLAEGGPRAVTMGTVAERAEVTRALVYKHFDNKHDLLAALYQREAKALDRAIRLQVTDAPDGFEPKLRAFTRAVLGAVGEHGRFFAPLRSLGVSDATRRDQRSWDRRTVGYFADLAATEFALDPRTARSVMSILLSGVDALVAQVRSKSTAEDLRFLEDTYVNATLGALSRVSDPRWTVDR